MIDEPTKIKELDKTAVNKELAKNFIEDILRDGKMGKLTDYFDDDNYIQHNP